MHKYEVVSYRSSEGDTSVACPSLPAAAPTVRSLQPLRRASSK